MIQSIPIHQSCLLQGAFVVNENMSMCKCPWSNPYISIKFVYCKGSWRYQWQHEEALEVPCWHQWQLNQQYSPLSLMITNHAPPMIMLTHSYPSIPLWNQWQRVTTYQLLASLSHLSNHNSNQGLSLVSSRTISIRFSLSKVVNLSHKLLQMLSL